MNVKTIVLASALALAGAAAGQAATADGRALFYVHSAQVFDYGVPLGLLNLAKDWVLATDRTTTSIVRFAQVQVVGFGPAVESRLGVAPPPVFDALTASFAPAHVGTLAGNCMPYQVPAGQSYRMEITWYGQHGRVNHIVVASDFTAPCPPEMFTLLNAVASFESAMVNPNLPVW
jgi:hypothetical protein